MDKTVLFFELGYFFKIVGVVILIQNLRVKRHIEGISFYTQLLFCLADFVKLFYFHHTVLYDYWFGWLELVASLVTSAILMACMIKYKPISLVQEKNEYDYRIIIVISAILAVISNYEKDADFEWSQFAIRFSIILEALGLLPQIKLMTRDKYVQRFMGNYLVCICLSRICRVGFWVCQIWDNTSDDTYYTLLLADLFYIVLTGDFIYNFVKHRNTNVIPYN